METMKKKRDSEEGENAMKKRRGTNEEKKAMQKRRIEAIRREGMAWREELEDAM